MGLGRVGISHVSPICPFPSVRRTTVFPSATDVLGRIFPPFVPCHEQVRHIYGARAGDAAAMGRLRQLEVVTRESELNNFERMSVGPSAVVQTVFGPAGPPPSRGASSKQPPAPASSSSAGVYNAFSTAGGTGPAAPAPSSSKSPVKAGGDEPGEDEDDEDEDDEEDDSEEDEDEEEEEEVRPPSSPDGDAASDVEDEAEHPAQPIYSMDIERDVGAPENVAASKDDPPRSPGGRDATGDGDEKGGRDGRDEKEGRDGRDEDRQERDDGDRRGRDRNGEDRPPGRDRSRDRSDGDRRGRDRDRSNGDRRGRDRDREAVELVFLSKKGDRRDRSDEERRGRDRRSDYSNDRRSDYSNDRRSHYRELESRGNGRDDDRRRDRDDDRRHGRGDDRRHGRDDDRRHGRDDDRRRDRDNGRRRDRDDDRRRDRDDDRKRDRDDDRRRDGNGDHRRDRDDDRKRDRSTDRKRDRSTDRRRDRSPADPPLSPTAAAARERLAPLEPPEPHILTSPRSSSKKSPPHNPRLERILATQLPRSQRFHDNELKMRSWLPAYKLRNEFLTTFADNDVVVLCGETGSGKTTQLPQLVMDFFAMEQKADAGAPTTNGAGGGPPVVLGGSGASSALFSAAVGGAAPKAPSAFGNTPARRKKVICTQPRRISATSVAERVAVERASQIGQEIGYQVRHTFSPKVIFVPSPPSPRIFPCTSPDTISDASLAHL